MEHHIDSIFNEMIDDVRYIKLHIFTNIINEKR